VIETFGYITDMDVKSGATVGFIAAAGGLAGAVFGVLVGGIMDSKNAGQLVAISAGAGALVGAFAGGAIVAPSPPATGTAGLPAQLKG